MNKLYLIGSAVVFLIILILVLPQIAATCVWYAPVGNTTLPAFVLMQAAGLGVILGGLLVLLWKSRKEGETGSGDNDSESN
jgi:hypothetical protein